MIYTQAVCIEKRNESPVMTIESSGVIKNLQKNFDHTGMK